MIKNPLQEARNAPQAAPKWSQEVGKQLVTTAGPPHVPENSLHHRGATARTGEQLAPTRCHRKYRTSAGEALKQLLLQSSFQFSL